MAREIAPKKNENILVHRYILQPYRGPSSRLTCPNCGAKHSFAPYIDVETGETLDSIYGRCDRVEKCSYFNTPYGKDLENKSLMVPSKDVLPEFSRLQSTDISLISQSTLLSSLTFNDNFSKFLYGVFSPDAVTKTLLKYKVGESDKWEGSTTFWQIDRDYDVRTGKTILYDIETGKRVKIPYPKITWEHVSDKGLSTTPDYNLKQCLFGEHLVSDKVTTYKIVEAEKTAIICSIVEKDDSVVWLSVGGIEMINEERLKPLEGANLIFFPDKGEKAFNKWAEKLQPMEKEWSIKINRTLEKTDLEEGSDLGDYILKKFKK